uniref:Uncharacterized protein n=1 Tax=Cacopsylla melanoneura TaxID=428564 RepID=A0A8D8YDQ5_9HEMI
MSSMIFSSYFAISFLISCLASFLISMCFIFSCIDLLLILFSLSLSFINFFVSSEIFCFLLFCVVGPICGGSGSGGGVLPTVMDAFRMYSLTLLCVLSVGFLSGFPFFNNGVRPFSFEFVGEPDCSLFPFPFSISAFGSSPISSISIPSSSSSVSSHCFSSLFFCFSSNSSRDHTLPSMTNLFVFINTFLPLFFASKLNLLNNFLVSLSFSDKSSLIITPLLVSFNLYLFFITSFLKMFEMNVILIGPSTFHLFLPILNILFMQYFDRSMPIPFSMSIIFMRTSW